MTVSNVMKHWIVAYRLKQIARANAENLIVSYPRREGPCQLEVSQVVASRASSANDVYQRLAVQVASLPTRRVHLPVQPLDEKDLRLRLIVLSRSTHISYCQSEDHTLQSCMRVCFQTLLNPQLTGLIRLTLPAAVANQHSVDLLASYAKKANASVLVWLSFPLAT